MKTYSRKNTLFKVALLLATSSILPSALWAQNAPPATADSPAITDNGQIGEIVVTAQRRAEALSKVPIAVTAITSAQLQTSGVSVAMDLPHVTPGLTTGGSSGANVYFTPVLRGVGSLNPQVANDNSIALYIDGIYQSDKGLSNIDLAGITQIDVLKGPQGTLFGRNATGGAINVTTRGPTDQTEIAGEVSYGNLKKFTGHFFAGIPITDNLGISVAYLHRQGGNYENDINPLYAGKFGGSNVDAVTAKIKWNLNKFEAIASAIYFDRMNTDLNALSPEPGTVPVGVQLGGTAGFARYTYTGEIPFSHTRFFQPSLKLRYSLPGVDLVSLSGYVRGRYNSFLDYDGTSLPLFNFGNRTKIDDFSQEFQALTTGSGRLQLTGGLYFYTGHPKVPALTFLQNIPTSAVTSSDFHEVDLVPGASATRVQTSGKVISKAVYAQATYAITDTIKFTGGLRYSIENRDYHYTVGGAGGPGTELPPTYVTFFTVDRPEITYKKPTWRFALDDQFRDDILGYISYNRGFKSGIYNFGDFTAPGTPGGFARPVKPEVLDAFEAGIKSKFLDRTLQVDLAAFYYDYQDLQVALVSATTAALSQLQNAGSEHIYGVDGDIIYRVNPDFTVRINGSYLHARFGSYKNAGGFLIDANGVPYSASIDASGTRGLGAPTLSFDVGADYTFHFNQNKFVVTGDYYHTSSFKTVVGDGNIVTPFGRLNAAATFYASGSRYYIRAFGQNLTNVEQTGTATSPFRLAKVEIEPRTYGIAIGFDF